MQRYKSILNPIIFTLEITECILLQAFGILIEFTIVSENNEHLPYPSDAFSQYLRWRRWRTQRKGPVST